VLLGQGKVDEARQEFRRLEQSGQVFAGTARLYLAGAYIYEGRFGAAVEELEAGIRLDRKFRNPRPERLRRYLLARIHLQRGDVRAARLEVDSILSAGVGSLEQSELRWTGMLLARLGDRQRAQVLLQRLDALRDQIASADVKSSYNNVAAEIAASANEDKQAEELFLAAIGEYPRAVSILGLARVYTARHDWIRARAEWESVIQARGEILFQEFPADWVLAHLEAGRATQAAGDPAAARAYYDAFLQTWRRADDLPVLRQAVAERKALGEIAVPAKALVKKR